MNLNHDMKKVCTYLVFLSLAFAYSSCKKNGDATKAAGSADTIRITNAVKKPFNVYGFIVYGGYVQNGANVNANNTQLQQYLLPFGIKKFNLLYEQKLLDYPNGDTANGVPNISRVDSLANQALADPTTLVSFDLEGWNRSDTVKTPSRLISVIQDFKLVNAVSPVGLYSSVPLNTYGYTSNIHAAYDKYNKGFASVASEVNYFSPSLYNYNGVDSVAWKNAAAYNVQACRLYGFTLKKIIPYITPEVTVNGVTTLLSYNDMMLRLQTLYNLGADGCIVWTSSGTRDASGNKIYVDVNSGWTKALKDFTAAHP
jgi:hypothetical protein